MKKLLHERLRELSSENTIVGLSAGHGSIPLRPSDARYLADEIERYYIPRPRFEDGEPVKAGSEIWYDETRNATVEWYKVDDDGFYEIETERIAELSGHVMSDFIKYPSPKALDADGVETKDGDTVWHIKGSDPLTVTEIRDGKVRAESTSCSILWYKPEELTHKEPDSLITLRDDMKQVTDQKDVDYADMEAWINRLSALIERGA